MLLSMMNDAPRNFFARKKEKEFDPAKIKLLPAVKND
jgi:hypothetical protein